MSTTRMYRVTKGHWCYSHRASMPYEKPTIETYGSVEEFTENVDDGYGPGAPPPTSGDDG